MTSTSEAGPGQLDVQAIREHFAFGERRRVVTNNAASTQPPRELLALYESLAPGYENVHRGQSTASREMTELFEDSYDTIAQFIGAPGRASIALYRNTTEAINAVMYSLLTEFRDGDNVVTTTELRSTALAIRPGARRWSRSTSPAAMPSVWRKP
jgi:cysteine desulfurase / selenocysteine lyase